MYRLFMIQRVKAKKNIRHINITSHVYTIIPFIFVYNILIISYIYIYLYIIYTISNHQGCELGLVTNKSLTLWCTSYLLNP